MGRRKDHTRQELKSLAIDAAYDLVRKGGYSGISMRKVAEQIGYAPGTLYNVFDDFDELILHVNARVLDHLQDFLHERLARSRGTTANRIKTLALAYLDFSERFQNEWASLYEHDPPTSFTIPAWYHERVERVFALAEVALSDLIPGTRKKRELVARVIWAGVHGIAALAASRKLRVATRENAKRLCESLVDNYLRGMRKG